jgi:hypothetical protein
MLNWVAKVFRSWIEVILWLILIISTIAGGVIGGLAGSFSRHSGGYIFWGVVLGLAIGLITVVIGGGILTNFLSLVDNVALLKKKFCEEDLKDSPQIHG